MKKIILVSLFTALTSFAFSQEQDKEDESKMIREVVSVQVDKASVAAPPAAPATPAKKGKKQEEPAPDTTVTSSTVPAPASELANRAKNWSVTKPVANKYTKNNCTANGNGATCNASFVYKSKELNPAEKIDGEIVMTITIEAKEGKYRYTINNIKHKSIDASSTGGDIYLLVPECGSMKIGDLTWKRIKGAALADARLVADELKAFMSKSSKETAKKDEW